MDTAFTSSLHTQEDGSVVLTIPPHVLSQIPRISGQTFWIRMGKRRSNKQNDFLTALVRARLLHNSIPCTPATIAEEKARICSMFGVHHDGEPIGTSQYTKEEMSELLQRLLVDCADNDVNVSTLQVEYA
tara:strand:+ start:4566 stop:4955 length:390 start_codon:yes stop_codon:yes gene_type:complete